MSKQAKRILIVEDEQVTASLLAFNLSQNGFSTQIAKTAADAYAQSPAADLIILDLGLPDGDGLSVCRYLRAESTSPILILTGQCGEHARVAGLSAGADDYLEKPFSMAELLARVFALFRRADPGRLTEGVRLCADTTAVCVGQTKVFLTRTEFALLSYLSRANGRAFSREELLKSVWGHAQAGLGARGVDVAVARLRHKFAGVSCPIQTVRGVGYRFRDS